MNIQPLSFRILHQIICNIGMNHRYIRTVNGRSIHSLQNCRRFKYILYPKLCLFAQIRSGSHLGFLAVSGYFRTVVHICAADNLVANNGVNGSARLICQLLCSLNHNRIHTGQFNHICQFHIVTILIYRCGHRNNRQLASCGCNAFRDRSQCLGQTGKFAEFNGFSPILRNRTFLTELIKNKTWTGKLNQCLIIKRLHFCGQTALAAGRCICRFRACWHSQTPVCHAQHLPHQTTANPEPHLIILSSFFLSPLLRNQNFTFAPFSTRRRISRIPRPVKCSTLVFRAIPD